MYNELQSKMPTINCSLCIINDNYNKASTRDRGGQRVYHRVQVIGYVNLDFKGLILNA